MPSLRDLTESLDNLYTTTWQKMKSEAADNIYDGSPFWFWLRDQGKLRTEEGGRFITEPVRYAIGTSQYVGKGGTVDMNDQEFLTISNWDWRYLIGPMVRFGVDDQKNRGKAQIINFASAKLENTRDGMADKLEDDLCGAQSGLSINGLRDIVADDPTASSTTCGGIDPNIYTWWRNQTQNMTGISYATQGLNYMRTMYNNCGKNMRREYPDLILSDQTTYERYDDTVLEQKRVVNQKLADAEFENIVYRGTPMVWTASLSQRMYMLNTRYMWFCYDPLYNFEMTEWKSIPNQVNDRAAQIVLAGNLITNRRRVHGVMYNLDTA